ncbi:uncharacterized protein LOC106639880 [Copidosoma floridanum]|uniref:uncharacterized protein LOC106639880 n=1 Tax=Copidosoma floridanum TaxID=29053 RepID=UPI0006C985E7|nr:uncharacterized protein LOC106639880 [Copidosoma floridanum]XP_014209174.1 uncharacterized protein LOC106639880 [Copidosoma floridanum]XP_014209175.1 uncharacterized protein LOC106639880 [Copidosoma floridanum]XP_014209176.1 uncharacterized protein LOC106639880 [Copidosoma floridanum]XP_023245834.1 uncharacterized protein LOC106639880 [Copidosoma floridanum]
MVRSHKFDNNTLDVLNKGCLDLYDEVACGRISVLVILSVVTLIFVVLKIIKYHSYKHLQIHQYAIFYITAIECIVCAATFIFGIRYPQLHFATNVLKLYQFIFICHFYWSMAARSRHRDGVVHHVINPVLCLYALYCITIALMGMVDISGTWTVCFRPYWLMLSSADFIAVQLFAMVALYVTHSNRQLVISALMVPSSSSRTRDLWFIAVVYEVSAAVSVVFDAVMILMGKDENGCSGIYNHVQLYYSTLLTVIIIFKYFLPIWTLLCVFQPSRVKSRLSEVALTSHYNMSGRCNNPNHRFFLTTWSAPGSILYPSLSYSANSPMFGTLGDFSDSSPDASPTTSRYWTKMNDDAYCGYEKHFVNVDHQKDILESQYRMEQNLQYLERSLAGDLGGQPAHERNALVNSSRSLTTINEENANNADNPTE